MNWTENTADRKKREIPVHNLNMDVLIGDQGYMEEIMKAEIEGLTIFHKAYKEEQICKLSFKEDHATFLLILKGKCQLITENGQQTLQEESIIVQPNRTIQACLLVGKNQTLHFLEFTKKYSEQDKDNLRLENHSLNEWYCTSFQDCKPYVEKIKSPNTTSRTVLSNNIIPRVALGTVEAAGPDKVGEHSHPMLEQLFLGLSDNEISVYADEAVANLKTFSLLHIPLGSTHWVEVAKDCKMNYMWMDFFLTKDGEAWLDTHKHIEENNEE